MTENFEYSLVGFENIKRKSTKQNCFHLIAASVICAYLLLQFGRKPIVSVESDKKIALIVYGGVSKVTGFHYKLNLYHPGYPYTPLHVTYNGINKHIMEPNGGRNVFDVFIHCWNLDIRDEIDTIFDPTMSHYDNNTVFSKPLKSLYSKSKWKQVSASFSRSRATELMLQHISTKRAGEMYEWVMYIRPDVMLIKDIKLQPPVFQKSEDIVYVNNHENGNGDLHFITSSMKAVEFMVQLPYRVLDASGQEVMEAHGWIQKEFNSANFRFVLDGIIPGVDEEVYRKITFAPMYEKGFSFYEEYGVDQNDWENLKPKKFIPTGNLKSYD